MTTRKILLVLLALTAAPAFAKREKPVPQPAVASKPPPTVRTGVDLWRAGEWAAAVAIWQPFAIAGDPDAMFNLGQAYKLGRAVPMDKVAAREWYRKAAAKEHLPAQANLGILLFQAGEKPEAARWLKTAADRGEMRAQYVLGVAHWNGDGVPRSMPLAYAYLARASAQGLSEATGALNNLTRTIAPVDRANGWAIATSLAAGKGVPASYSLASVPAAGGATTAAALNRQALEAVQKPLPTQAAPGRPAETTPPGVVAAVATAPATGLSPKPVATPKAASVAVATPAVTPTRSIVDAMPKNQAVAALSLSVGDKLPGAAPAVRSVELPPSVIATPSTPADTIAANVENVVAKPVVPKKLAEKPPAIEAAPVGWRVQLGAFGKKAQAEAAWTEIKTKQKSAIGNVKPIYAPGKSIVKLQMGPFKTRADAKDACAKLAFAGRACFVTES